MDNAPSSTLEEILTRQGPNGIGGIDLSKAPSSSDQTDFDYPFSLDRYSFMIRFYSYVEQAKPGKFELKWSDWISQQ